MKHFAPNTDKIKDIMSKDLVTVNAEANMTEAYKLMHLWNIRHLPVVDGSMKVIGILSDRDIQRSINIKKIDSFQQTATIDSNYKVEDFMSWPVFTVNEMTSIEKAAEEMLGHTVSALIVCDSKGHHRGIVTSHDLLSFLLMTIRERELNQFQPNVRFPINLP